MSPADVSVRVVRPCTYLARRREAGEVLTVDPLTAFELIASTRCALEAPGDAAVIRAAVDAHNLRVCKVPTGQGSHR